MCFPQLWGPPLPAVKWFAHWSVSSSIFSEWLLFLPGLAQCPAEWALRKCLPNSYLYYNASYARIQLAFPRTCWDGAEGCPPLTLPAAGSQRLRILIKEARDSSKNVFHNLGSSEGFGDSFNRPRAFGCKHLACHSPTRLLKASTNQPSWLAALGRADPDLPDAARNSLGLPVLGPGRLPSPSPAGP